MLDMPWRLVYNENVENLREDVTYDKVFERVIL